MRRIPFNGGTSPAQSKREARRTEVAPWGTEKGPGHRVCTGGGKAGDVRTRGTWPEAAAA